MKTKNAIISVIFMILILTCAGCSKKQEVTEPVNIAFVLGVLDDETVVNTDINEFAALPSEPGTTYAFVSPESTPTTICDPGMIPDLTDRGYTSTMMDRVQAGIKVELTEKVSSYVPATDEIDMARALALAVRTLNSNKVNGRENILVIYCSGKSTSGLINMLETPVFQMDAEASARAVADKLDVSMDGVDKVVWYCSGDFGKKQPKINDTEKKTIRDFYTRLFVALGMDPQNIEFKDDLPSADCYSFADAAVSEMAVEGVSSDLVVLNEEIFEEETESAFAKPIVITEGQVNYIPDTSDFLDPAAAAKAIQPVAEYLVAHKDRSIVLYSTCAGDTDSDYSQRLAAQRSSRIAEILYEAGVEQDHVTVVAIKNTQDPYYEWGLGTGEAASVNRKTVIADINSELARQIMDSARAEKED